MRIIWIFWIFMASIFRSRVADEAWTDSKIFEVPLDALVQNLMFRTRTDVWVIVSHGQFLLSAPRMFPICCSHRVH